MSTENTTEPQCRRALIYHLREVVKTREAHEVVHEMGAPRITTSIRLGTRTDRDQSLADKVRSVAAKLKG